jgi:hypothetical protein
MEREREREVILSPKNNQKPPLNHKGRRRKLNKK